MRISVISVGLFLSAVWVTPTLAEEYNWSGGFGGLSVGGSKANTDAKVDFGAANTGMFQTDSVVSNFYDTTRVPIWRDGDNTNGLSVTEDTGPGSIGVPWEHNGDSSVAQGSLTGTSPTFNPSSPWPTSFNDDDFSAAISGRFGIDFQTGWLVIGSEIDGTLFPSHNFSRQYAIDESATFDAANGVSSPDDFSGTDDLYGFGFTDCADGEDDCSYTTGYNATYTQQGVINVRSSLDSLMTVRGRLGVASGNMLFFATGGLAAGQISMSSSADVSEESVASWSGNAADSNDGSQVSQLTDTGTSSVSSDTDWSGKKSKTAYGYALGGGFSHAVTDNLIWTTDGYYYDLGRHSMKARSTDSSYTISQRFDGYVVRTGAEYRF